MSPIEKLLSTRPDLEPVEIMIPERCAMCWDKTKNMMLHLVANDDGSLCHEEDVSFLWESKHD